MRHLRLDRYDLAILSALQQDGRMSKLRLADKIHLSPTPCWERLRRLEREGFILGYHAEVAISELLDVAHFLVEVTLSRHRAEDFSRFEQAVEKRPEVLTCYAVAGGFDYLLLVVAGDISDYQSLLQNWLETETGVERFFTYVVTRTVKQIKTFPLERFWNNRTRNEPNT
ncbi:Lrp/AsnC family transcriptional regulator [Acidihalobacter prosperus]